MNDLAGQRKFQPGCLLEDTVTRDVPMFLEKPARLRTWVQGRGGLWEGENPGIVSKSEYSVPSGPLFYPIHPGGLEGTGCHNRIQHRKRAKGRVRMTATWRPKRATCSEQQNSIKDSWKKWNMFEHITNIYDWHMMDVGTLGKKLAIHRKRVQLFRMRNKALGWYIASNVGTYLI